MEFQLEMTNFLQNVQEMRSVANAPHRSLDRHWLVCQRRDYAVENIYTRQQLIEAAGDRSRRLLQRRLVRLVHRQKQSKYGQCGHPPHTIREGALPPALKRSVKLNFFSLWWDLNIRYMNCPLDGEKWMIYINWEHPKISHHVWFWFWTCSTKIVFELCVVVALWQMGLWEGPGNDQCNMNQPLHCQKRLWIYGWEPRMFS